MTFRNISTTIMLLIGLIAVSAVWLSVLFHIRHDRTLTARDIAGTVQHSHSAAARRNPDPIYPGEQPIATPQSVGKPAVEGRVQPDAEAAHDLPFGAMGSPPATINTPVRVVGPPAAPATRRHPPIPMCRYCVSL